MSRYSYDMGFEVDGTAIPDPSGFSGSISDLDASAERDVTGLLHREWVAQKVPTEMRYTNIDWSMCETILQLINHPSFSFTYPDPNLGALRTGTFYTGDRKWDVVWAGGTEWIANLTFSVIEY